VIVDDYRPAKPWVIGWAEDFGAQFSPYGELVARVTIPVERLTGTLPRQATSGSDR
jgi:hypothetical protein